MDTATLKRRIMTVATGIATLVSSASSANYTVKIALLTTSAVPRLHRLT